MANVIAYLITEEAVQDIADLTGHDVQMLKNNPNWVSVFDHRGYYPEFRILPRRVFEAKFPDINYSDPKIHNQGEQ